VNYILIKSTLLAAVFLLLSVSLVFATGKDNGQETCPKDNGWTKVDGLTGTSYFFTVPDGFHVVSTCYKAGTKLVFADLDPHQGGVVEIVSEVLNRKGEVRDLSHASFLLADWEEPEEPDTPVVTVTPETPITELPATGNNVWFILGFIVVVLGAAATIYQYKKKD